MPVFQSKQNIIFSRSNHNRFTASLASRTSEFRDLWNKIQRKTRTTICKTSVVLCDNNDICERKRYNGLQNKQISNDRKMCSIRRVSSFDLPATNPTKHVYDYFTGFERVFRVRQVSNYSPQLKHARTIQQLPPALSPSYVYVDTSARNRREKNVSYECRRCTYAHTLRCKNVLLQTRQINRQETRR